MRRREIKRRTLPTVKSKKKGKEGTIKRYGSFSKKLVCGGKQGWTHGSEVGGSTKTMKIDKCDKRKDGRMDGQTKQRPTDPPMDRPKSGMKSRVTRDQKCYVFINM